MGSKKAKSPKSSPVSSAEKPIEPETIPDNPLNSVTQMEPAPAVPSKTGAETLGKKGITLIDLVVFGAIVHYVAHIYAITANWHLSLVLGVEFISTILLAILVKGTFLYFTADEHRWFEFTRDLRHGFGVLLTINFLLFWALPIFGQGQMWKKVIQYIGSPIYRMLDSLEPVRWFARTFIYTNPRHADFFVSACLVTCSTIGSLAVMFYVQLKYGELPWSLVIAYYFMWVGLGGRGMGAAYTFAHKEGHNRIMYKPWIRNTLGNFFENVLGPFYGNMPWNFTTSHVYIHHRLDGGRGDTFYQWDLDRTSWNALMVYLHRIFTHMIGYASLAFFKERGQNRQYDLLMRGFITYTFIYPTVIMLITHSWSFLLWVYIQPLLCMTYFLAFMNFGFHGWIEFDPKTGEHIWCVNSTTIVDGEDDSFGEDDHMAHHYAVAVYYRDLPNYQKKHQPEYEHYHGSVFKQLSIVELSMFLLLKQWDLLADHYVDYSGKLTREEIKHMLKVRAVRLELPHKTYVAYTPASWVNRKVPKQDGHDIATGTIGPLTVAHDQSPVPSPTAAGAEVANGLTKRK